MQNDDSSGHVWREEAAKRRPLTQDAEALGRLIEHDQAPDEVSYYEAFADPDAQALDDAQRSYAGQYLRWLRRLRERDRHAKTGTDASALYSHPYTQGHPLGQTSRHRRTG